MIEINCDMGESWLSMENGTDDLLMNYVNSINISCGFHAGDYRLISKTINIALSKSLNIGAHPSYDDEANFGRKTYHLSAEEIEDILQLPRYEVIEKTPGLFVDQDGNIYISSLTPATVQINGREMKMSASDIATLLKSLPPDAISKIEIVRTPSAKYDATSSGGIVKETANGELSFSFSIRNHLATSFSTIRASVAEKANLFKIQKDVFKNALEQGKANAAKAFVFGDSRDENLTQKFLGLLLQHHVNVYELPAAITQEGKKFIASGSVGAGIQNNQQDAAPFFPLNPDGREFESQESTTGLGLIQDGVDGKIDGGGQLRKRSSDQGHRQHHDDDRDQSNSPVPPLWGVI